MTQADMWMNGALIALLIICVSGIAYYFWESMLKDMIMGETL